MGDYLGLSCFIKERNRCMIDEQKDMDIDDNQGSLNYDNLDSGSDNQQNSPIDDEYVRVEQEDAKLKLNQVLDRNTKQIANAVDETYFKLKECSNILLSRSRHNNEPRTLSSLDLSIDDAIGILDRLRELFSISNNKEQQRLMTKLPPEWDRDRISDWLRGSQHQARKSIELQTTTGDFSYPEDRRGNKPLDNQIELAVYNFYTCDEISCETSYKQQVIHPPPFRTPIPLRFLHLTIGKTFEQFTMKYPNMEIDVEIHDSASWSIWKKLNSHYELLHLTGTFRALLEEIDNLLPNFITHSFYTREQRDYIALIKEKSSITTLAVVQVDFAQNFIFVIQREVQSAYYSRQQATFFTVYIRIGEEHRTMVIKSDYLVHDTRFVYSSQKIIIDFLRKEYPNVFKINYVSDGASTHFKNKYNIHNLAHHHQDFQIEASWSFSSSGHGKGPCDGLGAVVKTTATQQLLKGRPNASFSTPKQFFERCLEKNDRMVVARSRRMEASNGPSTYMPDLNSPIEVRWLSAAIINNEFENRFSTAL
ncbi:unnamed protein product [Rotaria sp. Silwood2]|nr:unnamed protein product [Rotaria sp. Silwood2]